MAPVAVGSLIGGAALAVGTGALSAVTSGLSFPTELFRAAGGGTAADETKNDAVALQKAALQRRADALRDRIQRQLAAAGIAFSQPVELVGNGQGGIAVAPPHPQQAAIESALGSDVLLERDFSQLASDFSDFRESGNAADLPPTLMITLPRTQ